MGTWYNICMPRIKDIAPHIKDIATEISKINGVKTIYVWGSYVDNQDKPNYRIKDLDIIASTIYDSGDLLSIDNNIVDKKSSNDYLIEQGFNPEAVVFSKSLLNFTKYNIDKWVISSDKKLLHWGAMPSNQEEAEDIKKQAENHAIILTGISKKKLNASSEDIRTNWYGTYYEFMNKYFSNMPTGWYQSEEDLSKIIQKSIRII